MSQKQKRLYQKRIKSGCVKELGSFNKQQARIHRLKRWKDVKQTTSQDKLVMEAKRVLENVFSKWKISVFSINSQQIVKNPVWTIQKSNVGMPG